MFCVYVRYRKTSIFPERDIPSVFFKTWNSSSDSNLYSNCIPRPSRPPEPQIQKKQECLEKSVFQVYSECIPSVFQVYSKCVPSVFQMCSKCIPQVQVCSNCIPQTHSKCVPIRLMYSQVYSQEDMHSELAVQFGVGLRQFANTSWIQCWFWTMFQGTFWRYKLNTAGIQNKSFYWLPIYGWSGSCKLTDSHQCVLQFLPICLKYCACHEKVRPGHTKCCTCHARSSQQTWRYEAPKCNPSQETSALTS